jgi:hypothetical protein
MIDLVHNLGLLLGNGLIVSTLGLIEILLNVTVLPLLLKLVSLPHVVILKESSLLVSLVLQSTNHCLPLCDLQC